MKKINILDKIGKLTLKDDLTVNYGLYIQEKARYIELCDYFNELEGQKVHIRIINTKENKDVFNHTGILIKKKICQDYLIEHQNLSDVLWEITDTKIRIVIDTEDEDGVK